MKKVLALFLVAMIMLSLMPLATPAYAEEDYAWVLVDRFDFPISNSFSPGDPWSYYANRDGNSIELQTTIPYGLGPYSSRDEDNPGNLHAIYTWSDPPKVIEANSVVTIPIHQEVLSNKTGNYGIRFSPYLHMDGPNLNIGSATSSKVSAEKFYADGTKASGFGLGHAQDDASQVSFDGNMKLKFRNNGRPEQQWSLYLGVYAGAPGSVGTRYTYEWQVKPLSGVEAFGQGVRILWQPATGLGYRIFRSTEMDQLGISVSDFYITGESYADVNVKPNTTYYYTVKPVLAEAKPLEGIGEKLGNAIASYTVTTKAGFEATTQSKNFIMLKVNSPNMSINGMTQEVDPGRGTAPIIISSRTMVPIRSIVEAMGGSIDWEGSERKITIKARGNTVDMWVDKTDLVINGVTTQMDVAPVIQNGRTFVPVRFSAENLNCSVDWINSTQEAVIVYED